MSNNQTKLLVDDTDDEVTAPGGSCLPTKLLTFENAQVLGSAAENERYYRQLSDALDAALNL